MIFKLCISSAAVHIWRPAYMSCASRKISTVLRLRTMHGVLIARTTVEVYHAPVHTVDGDVEFAAEEPAELAGLEVAVHAGVKVLLPFQPIPK